MCGLLPFDPVKAKGALAKVRGSSKKRGFSQTIDLVVKLKELDLKKSGFKLQELVELPKGRGAKPKICVIGTGQMALEAKKIGVDGVLQREDVENLSKDKKAARKIAQAYDFFLAEAPLMPLIGKTMGMFLGPRDRMPIPIPPNTSLPPTLERLGKTVRLKVKDQPILQCMVGNETMEDEDIIENIRAILGRLEGKLGRGAKNLGTIYIKTTMGEPVKVEGIAD